MANDATKLITNAAKFTQPNMNPRMQKCMMVQGLAAKLVAAGGAAYWASGVTPIDNNRTAWNTIFPDMNPVIGALNPDQVRAAMCNVYITAGNLQASSTNSLLQHTNPTLALDDAVLDKAILWITSAIFELI